jgi:hypothetical protein
MNQNPFEDSAGVPWEGREFSINDWAGDDGSAPVQLATALGQTPVDKANLFHVLGQSRLLIPLIATIGESEVGSHGLEVDKSADLAIVAVSTPDEKTAIPAFSSVEQMTLWNPKARPVPVSAQKIALAAISEGHDRVVIDPASAAVAMRRPALAALAQGLSWLPAHKNPRVKELVSMAVLTQPMISSVDLFDNDPTGKLANTELLIQLGLQPGIKPEGLKLLLEGFHQELQSQEFLQLVDSIAIRLVVA